MTKRFKVRSAIAFAATSAVVATTAPAAVGAPVEEVAGDLIGPRGVAVGPHGGLFVTQADGSVSKVKRSGPNAGELREVDTVPSSFESAPALSINRHGEMFVLTGGGDEPTNARGLTGYGTLYKYSAGDGLQPFGENIQDYQYGDPDPYDHEGFDAESNPHGVAALDNGGALVADAANNDLLKVKPNGNIVTVARIMPRSVEAEGPLPARARRAPLVASEAVPTSVTVGADGYWYVGELRGAPNVPFGPEPLRTTAAETPDPFVRMSQIWRIKPGTRNAVCDPERPHRGPCQRFADRFTSIVDLEAGRDGSLYVTQLSDTGWTSIFGGPERMGSLAEEVPAPYKGSVVRLKRGVRTELGNSELALPGGVGVSRRGAVFAATVTIPFFGVPGSVVRLR